MTGEAAGEALRLWDASHLSSPLVSLLTDLRDLALQGIWDPEPLREEVSTRSPGLQEAELFVILFAATLHLGMERLLRELGSRDVLIRHCYWATSPEVDFRPFGAYLSNRDEDGVVHPFLVPFAEEDAHG